MARKVCSRSYEAIDDFVEEVQFTWGDGVHDEEVIWALVELKKRLARILPFDPIVGEHDDGN